MHRAEQVPQGSAVTLNQQKMDPKYEMSYLAHMNILDDLVDPSITLAPTEHVWLNAHECLY